MFASCVEDLEPRLIHGMHTFTDTVSGYSLGFSSFDKLLQFLFPLPKLSPSL